jgi:predicted dinucleotide-binding enzyme
MKITIIGAGNVGSTLAKRWIGLSHQVTLAVRDAADKKHDELRGIRGLLLMTPAAASEGSEIVVLATPWEATHDAIKAAGNLKGKIVIDATNPLAPQLSGLTVGFDNSAGEEVQKWLPDSHVVKGFNTVGFNIMANPIIEDRRAVLTIASDHAEAKKVVMKLATETGFDAVDAGPLSSARLTEPFAMLWIAAAYKFGWGREFAFSVIRR